MTGAKNILSRSVRRSPWHTPSSPTGSSFPHVGPVGFRLCPPSSWGSQFIKRTSSPTQNRDRKQGRLRLAQIGDI
eukprot:3923954-Rhodomonas_salina.1